MQRLLKSAYCFFAALLLTTAAAAQHKISGRVIDTTQEPLVGATITLKENRLSAPPPIRKDATP